MFLVYNLNIMIYRYDSFLFNYHATIINQLFNHHFSRFTRNRYTPKVLKTECFQESISLFCLFYGLFHVFFIYSHYYILFIPKIQIFYPKKLHEAIHKIHILLGRLVYITDLPR